MPNRGLAVASWVASEKDGLIASDSEINAEPGSSTVQNQVCLILIGSQAGEESSTSSFRRHRRCQGTETPSRTPGPAQLP